MLMGAIQVKNVSEGLHERMRERARARRLTLSQYILDLIERDLRRPSWDEWLIAVDGADLGGGLSAGEIVESIHSDRREREDELARRAGLPPVD